MTAVLPHPGNPFRGKVWAAAHVLRARTTTGFRGRVVEALPLDALPPG